MYISRRGQVARQASLCAALRRAGAPLPHSLAPSLDSLRGSSVEIGTIQRRIAWPHSLPPSLS